ncbi:hypothetical protein ACHAQF_002047 [Verticillium nonalfalfae]
MDDFNITPKSANQDFNGLNPTGSLDRNVTPGFLAAQDLTYLGPVYSDYDNSRVSDYVDRSDMVSEYASDNDDNVRRVPELKGQYWPGMHLFDSATEEGKKKRNQRKDDSVIQRMRIGSDAINPTEMVTDMMMNFERYRHIDEDPSDDEVSPLKGSASKKKAFIHKPSVVSEHILKRRSKALATMGGRLSTPTKSTPRKTFNGFEPQVIPGHGMIQPRDFYQGIQHQSLPQSGHNQSSFYHSHPYQQSYAYPDPMFHDGMFQDRSGSVRSPQVVTWNTANTNTNENTNIYGGQPWSVISAAERGYASQQNTAWVDAGRCTAAGSAGVLSGGNLSASVSAMPTSGPESLATSPVTGVIKLDPAQESTDGQSYHFDDAMEAMGH